MSTCFYLRKFKQGTWHLWWLKSAVEGSVDAGVPLYVLTRASHPIPRLSGYLSDSWKAGLEHASRDLFHLEVPGTNRIVQRMHAKAGACMSLKLVLLLLLVNNACLTNKDLVHHIFFFLVMVLSQVQPVLL